MLRLESADDPAGWRASLIWLAIVTRACVCEIMFECSECSSSNSSRECSNSSRERSAAPASNAAVAVAVAGERAERAVSCNMK